MNGDSEPNSPSRQCIQYARGNQHTVMSEVTLKVASQATPKTQTYLCLFFIFSDFEKQTGCYHIY